MRTSKNTLVFFLYLIGLKPSSIQAISFFFFFCSSQSMCFSQLKFMDLNTSLLRKVESFKRLKTFLNHFSRQSKKVTTFLNTIIKNTTFHDSKLDNNIREHNRDIQGVKMKEQAMNPKAIGQGSIIHDHNKKSLKLFDLTFKNKKTLNQSLNLLVMCEQRILNS